MAKRNAADSLIWQQVSLPHEARSFADLPDSRQAPALLAELAAAPCAFAPTPPPPAATPLALYGAGSMGRLARDFLKMVGHDASIVIDRNARQIARSASWAGTALREPDDIPPADRSALRVAVSIVTSPYVPIERSLAEIGFVDIVPFYDFAESFRARHPLSNGWFAPPLTAADRDRTTEVLARWDDDVSRAHHLQFLAWRRLRQEWTFQPAPPLPNETRFFIPEVANILHGDEVLIDAGAYDGGVSKAFIQRTSGAFREIVAIEPDASNRALLVERLQALLPGDTRVTVHDFALGEADGVAPFHDGLGYASQLAPTGGLRITVRPLDALDLAPTFMKLHLEGAELAALKGAQNTLSAHRPLIAATVYHNADGIWKTARWLMQTLDRYRFLFRLHTWCGTGAVIYAIPEERGRRQ